MSNWANKSIVVVACPDWDAVMIHKQVHEYCVQYIWKIQFITASANVVMFLVTLVCLKTVVFSVFLYASTITQSIINGLWLHFMEGSEVVKGMWLNLNGDLVSSRIFGWMLNKLRVDYNEILWRDPGGQRNKWYFGDNPDHHADCPIRNPEITQ